MKATADNDILLKGACYGILSLLIDAIPGGGSVGMLGTALYVVPAAISRQPLQKAHSIPTSAFDDFASKNEVVEPTEAEQRLAVELEKAAQSAGLALDSGESQLAAITACRGIAHLATGDKRAIVATETLVGLNVAPTILNLRGRLLCLERLVMGAISATDHDHVRGAICGEPDVDKALSICFACHRPGIYATDLKAGLNSYIEDLRRNAPQVLAK